MANDFEPEYMIPNYGKEFIWASIIIKLINYSCCTNELISAKVVAMHLTRSSWVGTVRTSFSVSPHKPPGAVSYTCTSTQSLLCLFSFHTCFQWGCLHFPDFPLPPSSCGICTFSSCISHSMNQGGHWLLRLETSEPLGWRKEQHYQIDALEKSVTIVTCVILYSACLS